MTDKYITTRPIYMVSKQILVPADTEIDLSKSTEDNISILLKKGAIVKLDEDTLIYEEE